MVMRNRLPGAGRLFAPGPMVLRLHVRLGRASVVPETDGIDGV
jgi:hypothetical protein